MKIVVLASSSTGNSTYVECGNIKFLIDAGMSFSYIKEKLFTLGVTPDEINFILVTHAHNDHVRCIHTFARVYDTKIYIGENTYKEYQKKEYLKNYEFVEDIDNIMGINIKRVPISHDKSGYGYILEYDGIKLAYITDTGMIHSRYHEAFNNMDVYLFESNHDVEMEMNGTKDEMTKIRNIGDEGHLSNEDCARYLSHFVGDRTKYVMLMHLSEHDNTVDLAFDTNRKSLDKSISLYVSKPNDISDIIEL